MSCRGRKRAIWISESADLVYDCRRDLDDIGFSSIPVRKGGRRNT